MKVTNEQLKQIIKEELEEAMTAADFARQELEKDPRFRGRKITSAKDVARRHKEREKEREERAKQKPVDPKDIEGSLSDEELRAMPRDSRTRRQYKMKEGVDGIETIRERGNVGEMSNEVMQIISSMGDQVIMDSEDFKTILSEAVETDPEDQGAFWHELLDPTGFFEEAFQGMEQTADDSYDPDLPPMEEGKTSTQQLFDLIKEEIKAALLEGGATFGTEQARRLSKLGGANLSPKKLGPLKQLGNELAGQMQDMSDEDKENILNMIAQLAGLTGFKDAEPATAPTRDPSLEEGRNLKHCAKCGKKTQHEMGKCVKCLDKGQQNSSDA